MGRIIGHAKPAYPCIGRVGCIFLASALQQRQSSNTHTTSRHYEIHLLIVHTIHTHISINTQERRGRQKRKVLLVAHLLFCPPPSNRHTHTHTHHTLLLRIQPVVCLRVLKLFSAPTRYTVASCHSSSSSLPAQKRQRPKPLQDASLPPPTITSSSPSSLRSLGL